MRGGSEDGVKAGEKAGELEVELEGELDVAGDVAGEVAGEVVGEVVGVFTGEDAMVCASSSWPDSTAFPRSGSTNTHSKGASWLVAVLSVLLVLLVPEVPLVSVVSVVSVTGSTSNTTVRNVFRCMANIRSMVLDGHDTRVQAIDAHTSPPLRPIKNNCQKE
jgi:hypothetical protein